LQHHSGEHSPALCIIEEDINHGTLHVSQLVAVCLHSHLEEQSDPAVPDTVQSQIKFTVATPPTDIIERLRRDKEDMVHPCLLVNALELLAVHELLPLEVSVTNVPPREHCDGPPVRTGLERLDSSQDPLLHLMDQLVVLSVGIGQTKVCYLLGMEVMDDVADLFTQESQQDVLSEILGLTRGEVVWMQEGSSLLRAARSSLLLLFLNQRGPKKKRNQ
jgi:hypothetical protein